MNERNALSLSAIMASQDARRGFLGLSAVSLHSTANRLALALITLGFVASSLIIAALLNVHIA